MNTEVTQVSETEAMHVEQTMHVRIYVKSNFNDALLLGCTYQLQQS